MRAVWYEATGAADEVLQVGDMDIPEPVAGEVRVRLAASGVNPVDVKRRLGGRGPMDAPRVVPHFDGAGVIDAVGEGVDGGREGASGSGSTTPSGSALAARRPSSPPCRRFAPWRCPTAPASPRAPASAFRR